MKRVAKPVFFIVALILVLFACASFLGFNSKYGDIDRVYLKGLDDIEWGMDLGNGALAVFAPTDSENVTDQQLQETVAVMEQRLVNKGITDSEIMLDSQNKNIVVRFALKPGEEAADEVMDLGRTGELAFYAGTPIDSNTGMLSEDPGDPLLTGDDVDYAELLLYPDSETGEMTPAVALTFKEEAQQTWEDATREQVGSRISIFMDSEMISAPTVDEAITDGRCVINGDFTSDYAIDLVNQINGGSLPISLTASNYGTISPAYGEYTHRAIAVTAVAALAIVVVLMIVRYRLSGVVASIALVAQLAAAVAAVTGFFAVLPTFTLNVPAVLGTAAAFALGIAAQLHSAVCIKKQLASGKETELAVQTGFKDAFPLILDSCIVITLVALALIAVFGPGSSMFTSPLNTLFSWLGLSSTAASALYSFAYPLVVGVLSTFLFHVLASRLMLRSLTAFSGLQKAWLYGGDK